MAPTLVIVPGSFVPAHIYEPFKMVLNLQAPSLRVHIEPLQSRGRRPEGEPAKTMTDDTNAIVAAVRKLQQQEKHADSDGGEYYILAHSYGGIPTTHAMKDLGCRQDKSGKGIKKMMLLNCVVSAKGVSNWDMMGDYGMHDNVDIQGDYLHIPSSDAHPGTWANLPYEEARHLQSQSQYHSLAAFKEKAWHEGWRDVEEVVYLSAPDDAVVHLQWQERGMETIRSNGGNLTVKKLPGADHAPISDPGQIEEVVKIVREVCGV